MDVLKTGVDELMELVRAQKRLSISDAAKRLKQPEKTVQNWVDFLVEERVLGIEYKFTTPYIYINEPTSTAKVSKKPRTIKDEQAEFLAHAKEKGMPADKLGLLWKHHLERVIESRQDFFRRECLKRGVSEADAQKLFQQYKGEALVMHELRESG
jgi:hypothetical protein